MSKKIVVEADTSAERLDQFLSREVRELSRSRVQQLIRDGKVKIGATFPKSSYRVQPGELIEVEIPVPRPMEVNPEPVNLKIVYEDDSLLVIDKPRDLVVHPGPGHETGTLVNALLYHCRDLSGIGGVMRPGIVHRLDKDTSGLLVVAKNDAVHQDLARQLKERLVKREYIAVVWGRIKKKSFVISAPIGRDPRNRKKMAVIQGGREALTNVRVLSHLDGCTLIKAKLQTGRTHQVRVHLSYLGYPLVGDPVYGGQKKLLDETNWKGQALHSFRLEFEHPGTGVLMQFTSSLPPEFKNLLKYLRMRMS